ncbi:hypothetical protein WN55_08929 [Dufourea novaeangliae]|uniref:Uncharacterized protein n=1 Tax=Dufourea novaeangliae TaxID=178035 RepID=A0A154P522_DUFNO|nr:hypothetical protein WN55_08929 [Dufourea novaeangliae]
MFLGQETPSPSCTLYLAARSPIFIRLYLRLESVPLHFLLRSSSSSSYQPPFLPLPPPLLLLLLLLFHNGSRVSPPGTNAVTTTCKHSGICNSNAAKRGSRDEEYPDRSRFSPAVFVDFLPEGTQQPPSKPSYSINPPRDKFLFGYRGAWSNSEERVVL